MLRALHIFLVGVIIDFFLFPVEFTALPDINTKVMLAGLGIGLLAYEVIRTRKHNLPTDIIYATFFAIFYSIVNLIAVELNETYDYSYANYVSSFLIWMFSAFSIVWITRTAHKKISLRLFTSYFTVICVFQCVIALVIDKYEEVDLFLSLIFNTYKEGMEEIDRLYGIGAGLDPAGMRFGLVLVMISFVLTLDEKIKQNKAVLFGFMLSYGVITVIGNMISRSTSVGAGIGVATIILATGIYRLVISSSNVKTFNMLLATLAVGVPALVFLYNTDESTHDQLRFAFEGFFNWIERGKWETDSTNKLQNTMWIWPTDMKTWIIGSGKYGGFLYGTDIGYCRLILYSGVIGFSVFALMFVYCAINFMKKYPRYTLMFLIFLSLTFIYWVKTSTDIFWIYALLFCFEDPEEINPIYKRSIA